MTTTLDTFTTESELDWDSLRNSIWEPMRRPHRVEDSVLLADTKLWMARLPRGVRPVSLPQSYVRIANELCRLWNQPAELDAYFEDLLMDKRGGRQGFPALVREELRTLCFHAVRTAAARQQVLSAC